MPVRKLAPLAVPAILLLAVALMMAACSPSGPRDSSYAKAKAFFEKGDYAKAQTEVEAALRADPRFAAGYELEGRIQFRQQQFEPALATLRKAVELDPGLLDAQLTLGEVLLVMGRLEEASAKADLFLARRQSAEALLLKAAVERAHGKAREALAWCAKAMAKEPGRPEAYLLAAQLDVETGALEQAAAVLREGAGKVKDSMPLEVSLAQVYVAQKKNDLAEKTVANLVARHPREANLRLVLAEYYSRQGKQKEAENELRAAVGLNPAEEQVRVQLVDFLLARGRAAEAEAELTKGIAASRPGYLLRTRLARLYRVTGRPDAALSAYRAAIDLDPRRPEAAAARNELANLYLEMNQPDKALAEVEAILKESPTDPGAMLLKGKVLLAKGDSNGAAATFKAAIAARPGAPEPYLWLAQAQASGGQAAVAKDTLAQALKVKPGFTAARRALARIDISEGDLTSAKAELDRVLRDEPGNLPALTDLGALYAARGDLRGAERCFKRLTQLRPDHYLGYYQLGLLAAHEGKYEEAGKRLAKAFELAPDFYPAASALLRTYLARKEPARAVTWLKGRLTWPPPRSSSAPPSGWPQTGACPTTTWACSTPAAGNSTRPRPG
jgi:tetratricopeptide (TPR) repeat protein